MRLDFRAICATVDLRQLVTADIGPPVHGRWDCPFCGEGDDRPPWCGDDPNLAVWSDNRHWSCRDCRAKGDALDWLVRRMGVTLVEAARRLVPDLTPFQLPDQPRPAAQPGRQPWKLTAGPGAPTNKKKTTGAWEPDRAWKFRTFKLAEFNIVSVGMLSADAWAEARATIAEMRRSLNPEAAWWAFLNANPTFKATVFAQRASRSAVASRSASAMPQKPVSVA